MGQKLDIVGKSLETVRDAYLALEVEAAKLGLKINKQKTKYMIAAGNRTILDAGQTVAFGNRNCEVVNEQQRLQIDAFAACEHICGHPTWYARQS
jgi:hypothetical protein